ncbi:unnamed protein product [Bemisia tabaci]|uniref:CCR4-NOT transcription complex subunit 10 n=1 Tax=Bemisia tabaci TaxID=7038 RepID=A0A9P0AMU0_BEMTA|nr:unnamed protein product [Bemisia tabaci]
MVEKKKKNPERENTVSLDKVRAKAWELILLDKGNPNWPLVKRRVYKLDTSDLSNSVNPEPETSVSNVPSVGSQYLYYGAFGTVFAFHLKDANLLSVNIHLGGAVKLCSEAQSHAIPVAGLRFESLCSKNAQFLTRNGGDAPNIGHLRCHILAASVYVCLCLGDSILAPNRANSLLCQNSLSGAHKFLGHLYAAEALIILGQSPEAMDYLKLDYLNDLSLLSPPQKYEVPLKPPISWFHNNLTSAKNILQFNLAVALVIQEESEKSAEVLKSVQCQSSWLITPFPCQTCHRPFHLQEAGMTIKEIG